MRQHILNPSSILCRPYGHSWQMIVGTFLETPTHIDILPLSCSCVTAWACGWRWAEDGAALLVQAWLGAVGIVVEPCREMLQSLASHYKRGKGQCKRLPWAMWVCECVSVCVTPASKKKRQGSLSSVGLHLNLTDSREKLPILAWLILGSSHYTFIWWSLFLFHLPDAYIVLLYYTIISWHLYYTS